MRIRRHAICFFLLLASAAIAQEQKWVEVRSPNFVVSTNAGEKRGREIALRFEQMRRIFLSLIPKDKIRDSAPLQIIAFRKNSELKQVAPLWKGKAVELDGLYLKGDDQNFILLDASSVAGWHAVFHEYAHFLLNTNLPPTPLWFDEGFADFYSTIRTDKKNYYIGEAPPDYGDLLNRGMMPLERLLAVVHESREYNESNDRRSLFYAQSWLFVHYLLDNGKIPQATDYFVKSMYGGLTIAQAVETAFGMPLKALDADLQQYLRNNKVRITTAPLPEGMEAVTYTNRKLKDEDAQALVADAQLHTNDHLDAAMKAFAALTERDPYLAAAHRGLGYAYFRKGDLQQAERSFRRAANLDSPDPRVHYFVAYSIYRKMGSKIDPEDLVEMNQFLDHAIKLEPAYADAYNLKAFALSNATNLPEAIKLMKVAVSLQPRNEQFQLNLVNQYMLAHRWDEANALLDRLKLSADPAIAKAAEENAARLKEWQAHPLTQLAEQNPESLTAPQWRRKAGATDPELDRLEAAQSGTDTEPAPAKGPVKFVRAVLVAADCPAAGNAVLQLAIGPKRMKVRAPNAKKILVIGADEFQCGWKNKRVAINYRERTPIEGDLISIEVTTP